MTWANRPGPGNPLWIGMAGLTAEMIGGPGMPDTMRRVSVGGIEATFSVAAADEVAVASWVVAALTGACGLSALSAAVVVSVRAAFSIAAVASVLVTAVAGVSGAAGLRPVQRGQRYL